VKSGSFNFSRDFSRIMWGPTLTLLATRTVVAGIVWYVVVLVFDSPPGQPAPVPDDPLGFMFWWVAMAFIGIPIARIVFRILGSAFGGLFELLGKLMAALCSLALAWIIHQPSRYGERCREGRGCRTCPAPHVVQPRE
jgi:hypothetical protein